MSILQAGPWCDVCDNYILLDKSVNPFSCQGIENELHCHDKCKDLLADIGNDWKKLPNGNLRRAFERQETQIREGSQE